MATSHCDALMIKRESWYPENSVFQYVYDYDSYGQNSGITNSGRTNLLDANLWYMFLIFVIKSKKTGCKLSVSTFNNRDVYLYRCRYTTRNNI